MKHSVRRWVYILNVILAIPYVDYNDLTMEVETNRLRFSLNDDGTLDVLDDSTAEVLITFSEDCSPTYLSDWAKESVQWELYDYPMYE